MATKKRSRKKKPAFTVDRPSTLATKRPQRSPSREELAIKQVKFTVDLPEITRRSLKAKAAMAGVSMREFLLQALKESGIDVP